MTVQADIQSRIQAFAAELEALVRRAAIEAVGNALGSSAPPRSNAPKAATPVAARIAPIRNGAKRDPAVLAATVEKAATWIKANPGRGVEAMAADLKLATKDLALPIIKLLDAKRIKRRGVKRATKYFPA